MKYTVEITEIRKKQIIVNADFQEQALNIAEEVYHNGDEVLNVDNVEESIFEIIE